jgi:uncharacterized phage protein (TIGR02218 family)
MIKTNEFTKSESSNSVSNYAICWHIQLTNGDQLRLTNYNEDINIKDYKYIAESIFTYKSIEKSSELLAGKNEICGIICDKYFKRQDIINGKLNDAYIEIFLINTNHLDNGKLILNQGYVSNIKIIDNKFIANISSLKNKFNNKITNSFSQNCRAKFCDKDCSLYEENYKFYGTISKVLSNNTLFDAERNEENFYFNFGEITFISGNNTGLCFQVKNFKNGEIELNLPSIYKLAVGDTYAIIAGCDKNFSSCVTKFNNALNFRGEPYISKILTRL